MREIWFKPRRYGFGVTPANSKGWVALGVMLGLLFATSLAVSAYPHSHAFSVGFRVATAVWLVACLGVCWLKSDRNWRWHWGDGDANR